VRGQRHGHPLPLEAGQARQALLLEPQVTDGEDLVDQQDLGFGADRDGEGEPEAHPVAVGPQRLVHPILELGE
jgi:hypothetical protein